jgi:hypothetical protein
MLAKKVKWMPIYDNAGYKVFRSDDLKQMKMIFLNGKPVIKYYDWQQDDAP